jgi:hypothetical protein
LGDVLHFGGFQYVMQRNIYEVMDEDAVYIFAMVYG